MMKQKLQLAPYEQRLYDALIVLGNSSRAWKAFALEDASAPDSAAHRAARKLLMQHIGEAARQTEIPPSTLRRWCADGLVMAEKRGRDWFVDIDDAVFWRDDVVARRQKSQQERRARDGGHE